MWQQSDNCKELPSDKKAQMVFQKLYQMACEKISKPSRRQLPYDEQLSFSYINRFNKQTDGKFLHSYILPKVGLVVKALEALGSDILWDLK